MLFKVSKNSSKNAGIVVYASAKFCSSSVYKQNLQYVVIESLKLVAKSSIQLQRANSDSQMCNVIWIPIIGLILLLAGLEWLNIMKNCPHLLLPYFGIH